MHSQTMCVVFSLWITEWQNSLPCLSSLTILLKEYHQSFMILSLRWNCQGTTVGITDLRLITGQFQDHLRDQLRGHLHGRLVDHLRLISDSISDPISGQLCNHCYDCPHDCLYNCLIDHLRLITGKLHDELRIPNSDIAEAQDPGLDLREAMAKDRRIVQSLIIQCCTTCMYILIVSLMMGP